MLTVIIILSETWEQYLDDRRTVAHPHTVPRRGILLLTMAVCKHRMYIVPFRYPSQLQQCERTAS